MRISDRHFRCALLSFIFSFIFSGGWVRFRWSQIDPKCPSKSLYVKNDWAQFVCNTARKVPARSRKLALSHLIKYLCNWTTINWWKRFICQGLWFAVMWQVEHWPNKDIRTAVICTLRPTESCAAQISDSLLLHKNEAYFYRHFCEYPRSGSGIEMPTFSVVARAGPTKLSVFIWNFTNSWEPSRHTPALLEVSIVTCNWFVFSNLLLQFGLSTFFHNLLNLNSSLTIRRYKPTLPFTQSPLLIRREYVVRGFRRNGVFISNKKSTAHTTVSEAQSPLRPVRCWRVPILRFRDIICVNCLVKLSLEGWRSSYSRPWIRRTDGYFTSSSNQLSD